MSDMDIPCPMCQASIAIAKIVEHAEACRKSIIAKRIRDGRLVERFGADVVEYFTRPRADECAAACEGESSSGSESSADRGAERKEAAAAGHGASAPSSAIASHAPAAGTFRIPPISQILEKQLFLGSVAANEEDVLKANSIKAILNCAEEFAPPRFLSTYGVEDYLHLKMKDTASFDICDKLEEATAFIARNIASQRPVLVHCAMGVSRSCAMVVGYLIKHTRKTLLEALNHVFASRPIVNPNKGFMFRLIEWEHTCLAADKERFAVTAIDAPLVASSATSSSSSSNASSSSSSTFFSVSSAPVEGRQQQQQRHHPVVVEKEEADGVRNAATALSTDREQLPQQQRRQQEEKEKSADQQEHPQHAHTASPASSSSPASSPAAASAAASAAAAPRGGKKKKRLLLLPSIPVEALSLLHADLAPVRLRPLVVLHSLER